MELRKLIKNSILLLITSFLLCLSCTNDSRKFENVVINRYTDNEKVINLREVFDFKWDKLYVLTPYHYPEATDSQTISDILKIKCNKNRGQFERLLIFISDGKIVKSISTKYQKENMIDYKPLNVDFYFHKNDPEFFTSDKCNFLIKKEENEYALLWMRQ